MRVHRSRPDGGFTAVPNDTARDDRLSYHARGLLAEMLSRPDGWHDNADATTARGRQARGTAAEGRRATRAAIAELEAAGYLHRVREQGPGGRWSTEVHVYDRPTEVPHGGTPVRPAQTRVSPGGTEVPPTGMSVSGTSIRKRVTEDGKKKENKRPRHSSDGPPKQDPYQKTTEQIVTACLASNAKLISDADDRAAVAWMQRTLTLPRPHPTAAYTAYLARCICHARDQLRELVTMKADGDGYYFTEDAGPLLRQIRNLAAGALPATWDRGRVEAITEAAEARAWPEMTARQATEAGVTLRWKGNR